MIMMIKCPYFPYLGFLFFEDVEIEDDAAVK